MKKLLLLISVLIITASCHQRKKYYEDTSNSAAPADTAANPAGLTNAEELNNKDREALARIPEKPYIIEGKVIGGKGYSIILDRLEVGKTEPLTTQDLNDQGQFRLTGTIRQPELFQLRLTTGVIHLPVYPGDHLIFTINYNTPENFQVQGSLEPVMLRDMYYTIEKTNDKIFAMEDLQKSTTDKTKLSRMVDTLPNFYERIEKEKSANLRKFAQKVDTAFVALLAAQRLNAEYPDNFAFMEKLDKKFASRFPYTPFYKGLHEKVVTYAPVSPGHILPEIITEDINGKEVRPSRFRGKTLLIYFWLANSPDCISDFSTLKSLYDKYKGKGFEILNVNIDKDKANWQQALQDHNPPGVQVNDNAAFQSASAQTLLVSTAPYTFIADKEGRIVYKRQTVQEVAVSLIKMFGY